MQAENEFLKTTRRLETRTLVENNMLNTMQLKNCLMDTQASIKKQWFHFERPADIQPSNNHNGNNSLEQWIKDTLRLNINLSASSINNFKDG